MCDRLLIHTTMKTAPLTADTRFEIGDIGTIYGSANPAAALRLLVEHVRSGLL